MIVSGRGVPVSRSAVFARRCSVLLRHVVAAVIVVVGGLTMVVSGCFMMRRRSVMVAARSVGRLGHVVLPNVAPHWAGKANGFAATEFSFTLNNFS